LNASWSQLSGPAPATLINASSAFTPVLFTDAGTYVFQLTASDGELSSTDTVTVTVNAEPSLTGASLGVALGSPGPLAVGGTETLIATLTDAANHPIVDFPLEVDITGANAQSGTAITDAAGMARFTYKGSNVGTDVLGATTRGSTQLTSSC